MSKTAHRIYLTTLASIVVFTTIFLSYKGYSYYSTPLEERFYHTDHANFKAGGLYGHGLGIIGTLLILVGVVIYIARKRYKFFAQWGRLKYWLEFHIFLCTLGPVMILFHTAFKFGGIVSVAFWSMVAVVVSGVIGRYIYIQIPRSIEGRTLSLNEIQSSKVNLGTVLSNSYQLDGASRESILSVMELGGGTRQRLRSIRRQLRPNQLSRGDTRRLIRLIRDEMVLSRKIERLQLMHKLFKYWHVAHMPFAIIMLVIVVLHVAVTLAFGYTWIF